MRKDQLAFNIKNCIKYQLLLRFLLVQLILRIRRDIN